MGISSESIQKQIDGLKHDLEDRRVVLKGKIDSAAYPGLAEEPRNRLAHLEATYSESIERLKGELKAAQELEAKQAVAAEAKRTAAAEKVRERARSVWIQAGGDPSRFDDNWADIQDAAARERVVANLTNPPSRGISL